MKLNDSLRFPHPVLGMEAGGDYLEGRIITKVEVKESPGTGAVEIAGTIDVTHHGVRTLIERGDIRCVLVVSCLDTYLIDHYAIGVGDFKIDIDDGRLRGTVLVRPVLEVTADQITLPDDKLHPEFSSDNLSVRRGDVAGIGAEFRFEAGLDKLVPLESVFRLIKSPDLKESRFELITDKQAVEIAVSPSLYDQISAMRNSTGARNVLLSSLYLPCVLELLSIAYADPQPELRWYQAIESRCRQLGIELDGKDLASKAQRLLGNPLGGLYKAVEGLH